MNTKIVVVLLTAILAWAYIETGRMTDLSARFRQPKTLHSTRQVEWVSESTKFRVVRHLLGEVQVPLQPQRIVSLSNSATDSLLALNIKPILISTSRRNDSALNYLQDQITQIPTIRYAESVNLEAILEAKPDLIFAGAVRDGRMYNQLSKIAPTVCIASRTLADRELRLLDVGVTLGMEQAAQLRLEKFHQQIKNAKITLAAVARDRPVSFLRFRRNTCVIYSRSTMFGPLLFEQLGLTPDPAMPIVAAGGGWDVLSAERLSQLESEFLFIVVETDSETYRQRMSQTPMWNQIPAVVQGNVIEVDSGTWLGGDGVQGCEAIINDVLQGILRSERVADAR